MQGTAAALSRRALVVGRGSYTTGRTTCSRPKRPHVEIQFRNRPAQCITVHAQLPCRLTLIALVLLKHGQNELLLELAYCFRIKNAALMHLKYECFQLVFHSASLGFQCVLNTRLVIFCSYRQCVGYVPARCATNSIRHGSVAAVPPEPPRSRCVRSPA